MMMGSTHRRGLRVVTASVSVGWLVVLSLACGFANEDAPEAPATVAETHADGQALGQGMVRYFAAHPQQLTPLRTLDHEPLDVQDLEVAASVGLETTVTVSLEYARSEPTPRALRAELEYLPSGSVNLVSLRDVDAFGAPRERSFPPPAARIAGALLHQLAEGQCASLPVPRSRQPDVDCATVTPMAQQSTYRLQSVSVRGFHDPRLLGTLGEGDEITFTRGSYAYR